MKNNNSFAPDIVLSSLNNDEYTTAYKYIGLVLLINDIKVAKRELQLLAFIALNRDISSGGKKEEFCATFNSSLATVSNMIFRLKKIGLLIKTEKTKLHPSFKIKNEMEIYVKLKR